MTMVVDRLLRNLPDGTPPVQVPPGQGIQVTMPLNISRNVTRGTTLGLNRDDNECKL